MSLIQRQQAHVERLRPIYAKHWARNTPAFGLDLVGARSKANRLHIEEMRAAGYSRAEAADSAQQCCDMASLETKYDFFNQGQA